uniref:Glycosyl transferase family 1 domain-containing protein n=1 Tax=Prevotella sp. GTC17260 TaxID=3236796 RepID=A0AB33JMA3_9BACT
MHMKSKNKVFFCGNFFDGSGPGVVNRGYYTYLKNNFVFYKYRNKYIRILEAIWYTLVNKIIIFSGVAEVDKILIPLCRLFKKKMIYIMHGWLKLENELNQAPNTSGEQSEFRLLKYSDLILCVSEQYSRMVKEKLPHYSAKISYLTNGIDWELMSPSDYYEQRSPNSIILIGGGRRTKRNLEVCKAVELLNNKKQYSLHIELYGYSDGRDIPEIIKFPFVNYHGIVPHQKLIESMSKNNLFILNSEIESFSLGVVEALINGCNLLISKNVGARDYLIAETDNDIINNPEDIDEIAQKIEYVLKNPNNSRLLNSIDREASSISHQADKLYRIVSTFL